MKRNRIKPSKAGPVYRQLWRVVDGAITDALKMHPDYLTPRGTHMDTARRSIAKRVTGSVLGYALQLADAQGRSGVAAGTAITPAADRAEPLSSVRPSGAGSLRPRRGGLPVRTVARP